MTTPAYAHCVSCDAELIPQALWNAADTGDRRQWRREGRRKAAGTRCAACAQAERRKVARRADQPQRTCRTCPTLIPVGSKARFCDPCREHAAAEAKARRDAARQAEAEARKAAKAAEREQLAATAEALRSEGKSVRQIAEVIGRSPAMVWHLIGPEKLPPDDADSPDALVDGRWVLCPKTRVQKWVGARPVDPSPRGGRPEKHPDCGTPEGYRKHRYRYDEHSEGVWPLPPDDPCGCRAAHRLAQREKAGAT